jgi:hypothetical protein
MSFIGQIKSILDDFMVVVILSEKGGDWWRIGGKVGWGFRL